MTNSPVALERTDAVAVITLDDPERRNALTHAMKEALRDALAEVAGDDRIRAVVLTGAGKAFCVGQDLAEHGEALADGAEAAFQTVREHYSPIARQLLTMPKPVIAAVSGTAVGAGLGMALACDFRVFAAGVKLATAFSGIGLTFDSGLSVTLPQAVGAARARELMIFARTFTAGDAVAWGIAGDIVAPDAVLERATALAGELAAGPTRAYAITKGLLAGPLDEALEAEAVGQTAAGATDDHRAAVTAFLAKEQPRFTGR